MAAVLALVAGYRLPQHFEEFLFRICENFSRAQLKQHDAITSLDRFVVSLKDAS